MSFFEDILPDETLASVRNRIAGFATAAGLKVSNWILGGVAQQMFEAHAQTAYTFTQIAPRAIRGFASLDTSTDPGDVDPYDALQVTREPGPGYLSAHGANLYGTERNDATFATGFETLTNAGPGARTFLPDALTFTWTLNSPPTPAPTYRNADGGTTYTTTTGTLTANPDGSLTVPAGVSVYLPIKAEEKGTGSNAPAGSITLTTALLGCTATNDDAVLAVDREGADAYRDRCRIAPAAVSPNGPADAYRFIALGARRDSEDNVFYFPTSSTTALGIDSDGNLETFPNAQGDSLGITRVYVSTSSTTGIVTIYFATASGAPAGGDVTDLGALFDQVYWPDCTTRSFNAAVEVTITLAGTVLVKPGAGVTVASIRQAIVDALEASFPTFDIGGYNQTAGAGTIYKQELESTINSAHPNIYSVSLSSPASNTALAAGRVAVLSTTLVSWTVTIA